MKRRAATQMVRHSLRILVALCFATVSRAVCAQIRIEPLNGRIWAANLNVQAKLAEKGWRSAINGGFRSCALFKIKHFVKVNGSDIKIAAFSIMRTLEFSKLEGLYTVNQNGMRIFASPLYSQAYKELIRYNLYANANVRGYYKIEAVYRPLLLVFPFSLAYFFPLPLQQIFKPRYISY